MKLVVLTGAVLALIAATPAYAFALPYEKDWTRAAKKGRFNALPAPSRLARFVASDRVPGGDERGIGGSYTRLPRPAPCPRYPNQGAWGFFERSTDSADLILGYNNKVVPARCELGGGGVEGERIRRVRVLGARLTLYRIDGRVPEESGFQIRGTLRRHDLYLTAYYEQLDVAPKELVRIARSLRWVPH